MLLPLAVLLLISGGCGDDGGEPSNNVDRGDATVKTAELPADLSEYQRQVLGDGLLTRGEYEQAAFEVVRCHKENGARILGYPHFMGEDPDPNPWWSSRGQFMFMSIYPEEGEEAQKKAESCAQQYFSTINAIWINHIAPTEREMQEAREIVARCLREEGINVPEQPSREELEPVTGPRRMEPEIKQCLKKGAEYIGMPAFVA